MVQFQRGFIRLTCVTLLAAGVLLLLIGFLHQHFNTDLASRQSSASAYSEDAGIGWRHQPYASNNEVRPKVNSSSEKSVYAGLQVENVYSLSLKDRVFMAEGWYWLKWPEAVNTIIRENNIQQEKIIHFTNQVESSSLVVEVEQPNPERLANGDYWQYFHFSGKFYIDNLQLQGFPFDDLRLPFLLELGPDSLSCYPGNINGCISLAFDPGSERHVLGQYVDLNGYKIIGSESREFLHQYSTNFGHGLPAANSVVEVDILYRANFNAAFWSYVFPLLVLVGIAILSPSLPGALGDVRLAIPTTILLTLIFLQIGYKADLPPLDYVSYLDWLYIYAYAISAGLFLLFCWGSNAHVTACARGNEESVVRKINRVDLLVQGIAFAGLLLVLASGLLFQP